MSFAQTAGLPTGADRTRTLFGQVMGLVALTVACCAAGAYLGRDLGGASWFVAWIVAFGCLIGLNVANARGNRGLALVLLLVFGGLLGVSVGATLDYYAANDPGAVRQALLATALFVGVLGSAGYAIRRDLSFLYRFLFFGLLAVLVFGLVTVFVRIPGGTTIYALAGLAIFAGYTVVDFNRLRRAGSDAAIPLAAGIFLDVFNVFLLFLQLFGRR
ncbi:MAG: Bax inhibitor-1 family protein [Solirubrobacteraceae bacterium]